MKTQDLIKYGLIAVAAYLVYRYAKEQGWLGGKVVETLPPPAPPVTVQPSGPPPSDVAPRPLTLRDLLASAAGRDSGLNVYQWNYYMTAATGRIMGPEDDLATTGQDPNDLLTVDQYLGRRAAAGLSGLNRELNWTAPLYGLSAWLT